MSDNWNDDDELFGNGNPDGSSLRAYAEKMAAKVKALETENGQLKGQITEKNAVDVLSAKGYPAAVARLAIKDGVDASNEKAVEKWLTDNGDLFVKPEANQSQQQTEGDEPSGEQEAPPVGVQSVFGALNNIHAAASPALVTAFDRATASLPADATPEQVIAAYRGL